MYRLPDLQLADDVSNRLAALQAAVDAAPSFPEQVELAKTRFGSKPKATFIKVRAALEVLSGELVRCSYCEDSCADEVEHIAPKDFFPGLVFVWSNYVFSCGPCNGGKNNKAGIIAADGTITDLRAHRGQHGVVPAPAGQLLFVNPRIDQPLDFFWLDIVSSFAFAVMDEDNPVIAARARSTIDDLSLNRPVLIRARRNAFWGFRDRLAQYVAARDGQVDQAELDSRIAELRQAPHRTVWLEMKRQRAMIPTLANLFGQAPEALNW